jgi:flavin-dependent dehydrogenase
LTEPTEIFDTLIVGAGPAGLTASYLLTKEKGGSVIVLEERALAAPPSTG